MNQIEERRKPILKRSAYISGAIALLILGAVACGGGNTQTAVEATAAAPTANTEVTSSSTDGKMVPLAVPPGWVGRPPAYEVINGITVPPEPPPTLNNSTLAGVDVNRNGVRDDVERLLAREFGLDKPKHAETLKFAIAEQALIVTPSKLTKSIYVKFVSCTKLSSTDSDKATYSLLNTTSRKNAYGTALAGAVVGDCE